MKSVRAKHSARRKSQALADAQPKPTAEAVREFAESIMSDIMAKKTKAAGAEATAPARPVVPEKDSE